MAEDGNYCSLCAHDFNTKVRRPEGLHQLNDVLKENNYTQKSVSNELNELNSDVVELNHLLK
jgi:hypothetical protein